MIPSVAIATGTQVGERIVNRIGARSAVILGFGIGIPGTAMLAFGIGVTSSVWIAVPGMVISGLSQGVAWTAMWVAASSGVDPDQQGVANGLASTTLSVGNAIGLAGLTAIAAAVHHDPNATTSARGSLIAVLCATAAMALTIVAARGVPRQNAS